MKYDFITLGGSTEDITFYVNDALIIDNKKDILSQELIAFEQGAKFNIHDTYSTFGGGAANTAVNFARLGFRTGIITSLGMDNRSEMVIQNFKKNGIKINLIKRNEDSHTGFSCVLIDHEKERTIFSSRGANSDLDFNLNDSKAIRNTSCLYIASLSGNWKKVLQEIFALKDELKSTRIAWNPGQVQLKAGAVLLEKYIKKTDIFCVNKDEALELVMSVTSLKNKNDESLNDIRNLLNVIFKWGAKMVVITDGKNGVDVYDGSNYYHKDIMKEKERVDSTGLGDAFNSSFVAGLEIYKGDIEKAIQLGLRTTASVVAHPGAQNGLLSKKDI